MGKISFQSIAIIKDTEKGSIQLAAVEGHSLPVIVKVLKKGSVEVYQQLMQIENDHIPKVYGYEETEEGLLVVEEYVDGETLAAYLQKGVLSEQETVSIAMQLCEAVQALHEQNPPLIHKDIKPSNIIISSKGVVKLIDFDSSRVYKEDRDGDTRLLGTEHYAPPEQYGFSQTDTRSDIYSLGVVLSKLPGFSEKEKQNSWKKLLERCTLFAPESRYQSVKEVKEEIEKITVGNKKTVYKRWWGIGAVVLILLLGIGLAYALSDEKATEVENEVPVDSQEWENWYSRADCTYETPETGEDASVIWRQDVTDSEKTKQTKEKIIRENRWVLYYFRDRFPGEDLLYYTGFLDNQTIIVDGVSLYSYENEEKWELGSEEYYVADGILHVSAEAMDSIQDGFYEMTLCMTYTTQPVKHEHSWTVYVADDDAMGEKLPVIVNNWHGYTPSCNESLHTMVRNDSAIRITGLCNNYGGEVDASLYRILYEGRAIEFSKELLEEVSEQGPTSFWIVLSDGTWESVFVEPLG